MHRFAALELVFSSPIDANTLNLPGAFEVVGSDSGAHAGVVIQGNSGRDFRFFPTVPFALGESVTVSATAQVTTPEGLPIEPMDFSFGVLTTEEPLPTIPHAGTLPASETWSADSVHLITGDTTVPAGVTLTIEPGAIIKFVANPGEGPRRNLFVQGLLEAAGTEQAPIVFTSSYDDTYGGDTNTDGAATSGQTGHWGGIKLLANADHVFTRCTLRYGGRNRYDYFGWYDDNLYMLWVTGSASLDVDRCVFDTPYGSAIRIDSATAAISVSGCTLLRAGRNGIYATNFASGTFSGNVFTLNNFPVSQAGSAPVYGPNLFTGNTWQVIAVGETLTQNVTWQDLGIPYLVNSDLTIPASRTLSIEPGIVVKFLANPNEGPRLNIYVDGSLELRSDTETPIVFTSSRDDSVGGDTNGDGTGSSAAVGDWGGLWYRGTSSNSFHDAVVRFGGRNRYDYFGWYDANTFGVLVADSAALVVDRVTIERCYDQAIRADGPGASLILRDSLLGTCRYGLYARTLASGEVTGCEFNSNVFPVCQAGTDVVYTNNTFVDNTWQAIALAETLHRDVRWEDVQGLGFPYLVIGNVTIPPGRTTAIEAGVVVKFLANTGEGSRHNLFIDGQLLLESTPSQPIVFTSSRDDEHGGDTNRDGSASVPSPSDWGGLKFGASGINIIHDAILRYGGRNRYDYFGWYDANLHLLWVAGQATLVVRNSVIEHFFSNGVFADSMSAGLAVYENTIRGGRTGVYAQAAAGVTLMDNLLVSNVYPVCQGGVDIVYHGNEFVDNTWQAIAVSGTLNASCEWEDVQGLGMPYLVIGDTTIPEGRTLSIDPGIIVKMQANAGEGSRVNLFANGVLDLRSSACRPIVFTSSRDDTYGGDTNADGGASRPTPSDWGGLRFGGTAINLLHDAILRYGGRNRYDYFGWYDANTYLVWVQAASSLVIRDVRMEGFYQYAVHYDSPSANLGIERTSFLPGRPAPNNIALSNTTTRIVEARNNFWGDPSGPSGAGPGSGAAVTTNVAFEPWSTSDGSLSQGIVATSGAALAYQPAFGIDLATLEENGAIRAFTERFNSVLSQDLTVEAANPGIYDDSANLQITQLPAGIAVNSHLLHFNTAGMSLVTLEGTVTFDTVIIGVILSSELLNASDSTLGRDDLVYPSTTEGRGLELDDPTSQADLFEISADRRSIRYAGTVESHLDQIRVITLAGADCNGNGAPDACDIAEGRSADLNSNSIPDECENSCPCDWDDNGSLNSGDFFGFLGDFFSGAADFDGDGSTTSADFFEFLSCLFEGCP